MEQGVPRQQHRSECGYPILYPHHPIHRSEYGYTHAWYKPKDESSACDDYLYVGAELGYAIFVSHNISLDPALYWKHSFTDQLDQYGLKVGLSVYF